MDCESCGRHVPSDQVGPLRPGNGAVVMACGRCRRHAARTRRHVARTVHEVFTHRKQPPPRLPA